MGSNNWTDDQRHAALSLYFELEFGQFDQRNKKVIALSEIINRSPSAIAFKLGNFANLDPTLNRKGFSNVSKADRELISRFHHSPDLVVSEMARVLERYDAQNAETLVFNAKQQQRYQMDDAVSSFDVAGRPTSREVRVKVRVGQQFFRDAVLTGYKTRCCVCGLALPRMLEAAHIIDHSASESQIHRLRPDNGLALCRNHHRAFDCGFWTLDSHFRIEVDPRMHDLTRYDENISTVITRFDGRDIIQPFRYLPSAESIEWHRENKFAKCEPEISR